MKVSLCSPMPGFHKELFDIADLFLHRVERLEAADGPGDLHIQITETLRGGIRHCRVSLSGPYEGRFENALELAGDALLIRRLHKRQLKTALFAALRAATGQTPPWGSLTGIRPTRLLLDQMAEGRDMGAAADWMRDTFLLNDDKLSILTDIITVQQGLPAVGEREIACYIGIPFCVSRCRYCSFISRVATGGAMLAGYVRALVSEIEGTIELIRARGLTARSVYIGGGTPTVLDEALLKQVLDAARPMFEKAAEVTVEAGRPDTITVGKLHLIRDSGATRISVNPQSMHDRTLELVGRHHTARQTVDAFRLARESGINSINMDLIAGLPGENQAMFQDSLEQVLALAPEGVTVHTLAVKRSSDMHRFGDSLPEGDAVAGMVGMARTRLRDAGYEPYYIYRQKHMAGNLENIGYAKPGHACLYNIDMMEDQATVLAMGAGSVSKLVYPGRKRILRAPNVKDIDHYIARVDEMLRRKQDLFRGIGKGVRAPMDDDGVEEDLE